VAKQQTFAGLAWQNKGKQTKRERFLGEMDAIIPWAQLLEVIEPHYPKAGNGRPPLGLEKMLRIYFLQIWFNLSDPGAEEALYDSESMRRFARIELWHFGMKIHVGTDRRGVVHSVTATHAATADITQMNALLHGQERTIFGDQAYWKEADRQRFRANGVRYRVNRRRYSAAAADGSSDEDRPESVANQSARRARVQDRQATVGLREGTLPRDREERCPRIHVIRTCALVSDAAIYLASSAVVCLTIPNLSNSLSNPRASAERRSTFTGSQPLHPETRA
jgi:hypothetical protein